MFIWGSGHKTIRIPIHNAPPCGTCGGDTLRSISFDYDYSHIFWLFKGIKNKAVSASCETCGTVVRLEAEHEKDIVRTLGKNPIPFMDRYGAVVLLLLVAAWITFALTRPCAVNPDSQVCRDSR